MLSSATARGFQCMAESMKAVHAAKLFIDAEMRRSM
jgi:hypothetical protein